MLEIKNTNKHSINGLLSEDDYNALVSNVINNWESIKTWLDTYDDLNDIVEKLSKYSLEWISHCVDVCEYISKIAPENELDNDFMDGYNSMLKFAKELIELGRDEIS